MKKEINRMRVIFEIIRILAGEFQYIDVNKIKTKLENKFETELNLRTVKQYLLDIQQHFEEPLESRKGHDGGYKLKEDTRKLFAEISQLSLNIDDKNALNDAFEIAEKSASFYYYDDLQNARAKLYLKFNMKIDDGEHYVGQEQHVPDITNKIKRVKQAIINKKYLKISFKYNSYDASKEIIEYKPLFIVHDADETFLILKDPNKKVMIQNIRNVSILEVTDKPFILTGKYDVKEYVNKHTLSIKGEYPLKFEIIDEDGNEIFDVWNYDFEIVEENQNVKHIIFYEQYRVFEFLLRMQPHIKSLEMDESLKDKWNKIIDKLVKY